MENKTNKETMGADMGADRLPNNPDTKEIIGKWLKANGYDGLVCLDGPCGCTLEDLNPCGEYMGYCQAAYKHECTADCKQTSCEAEPGKGDYCLTLYKDKRPDQDADQGEV